MDDDKVRRTVGEVRELAETVLGRLGLAEPQVNAVAATIAAGERVGCTAHGLYRLLVCAHPLRAGKMNLDAAPRMHAPATGVVRIDCQGGYTQNDVDGGRPLIHGIGRPAGWERVCYEVVVLVGDH